MRYILYIILCVFSINAFSQTESTSTAADEVSEGVFLYYEEEEEDYESKIIEPANDTLQKKVELIQDMISTVNILRDKDSLVHHFCIFNDDAEMIPSMEGLLLDGLSKKIEIILHPNTDKLMYIREMIFNDNQVWDFVYERVYDTVGELKLFVRHYSTFESSCAEVAFELSEYFFDKGEVIAKTFEVYDENDKPLNIDDCWMDREYYFYYYTFDQLNSEYNLPIKKLVLQNEKADEVEDTKPIQEKE